MNDGLCDSKTNKPKWEKLASHKHEQVQGSKQKRKENENAPLVPARGVYLAGTNRATYRIVHMAFHGYLRDGWATHGLY